MSAVAKDKKKSEVPDRPKTPEELITEAFPPKDDEILRIHDVGKPCFRLNFWNERETEVVRSYFIEVVDGVAQEWQEKV